MVGQGWCGQQGRTFHVYLPEGRGMGVGHNGFTGSPLGRAGRWPGGLEEGKACSRVGLWWGWVRVGGQVLLFPSYDPRARGRAG